MELVRSIGHGRSVCIFLDRQRSLFKVHYGKMDLRLGSFYRLSLLLFQQELFVILTPSNWQLPPVRISVSTRLDPSSANTDKRDTFQPVK